ncbi:MAG: SusC/RagA family TonB-linked outer membrane protein [Thalassobius sp.]|nr:SusC/RagA family TonB-linked outer membrane protein [Thalassovita sp.]
MHSVGAESGYPWVAFDLFFFTKNLGKYMQWKFLQQIWVMSKYLLYGLTLQIFLGGMLLAGPGNAQTEKKLDEIYLSYDFKGKDLKHIFEFLEEETEFAFSYNNFIVNESQKIEISGSHSLYDLLSELSTKANLRFKRINGSIYVTNAPKGDKKNNKIVEEIEAVQVRITGTVKGSDGNEPLPGVSILIKGTNEGTTTDIYGNYSLNANQGDVLQYSFIGYNTSEVEVGSQTEINVILQVSTEQLDEVIVVGYGTQEKKEVTGSIAQIESKEILKSSAVSVSNALAGRVPGLIVNQTNSEPGRDDATIYVRGLGTTGNNSALIVVDGVANRDGISRIDPNDIESMTVLKDASAAIYGAQAANGVILITTKRGKTGKPSIKYNFNQGFVSPTRKMELADAALYTKSVNAWSVQQGQGEIYTDEQIAAYESGAEPSTDWQNEVYKNHSLQNRHSLTVSGGTEVVTYFLSAGTTYQNGLVTGDETTKYRQYNIRSNVDVKLSDRFNIGFDLAGRRENRKWLQYDDATIYGSTIRAAPTIAATIDGLPARGRENQNPLAIAKGPGYLGLNRNVFNGTFKAEYKIPGVEGLSVDGFAAVDLFQGFRKHWFQQYTFYEDTDGDGTPESYKAGPALSDTYLRQDDQNYESITLHAKIKYERQFGDHNIAAFMAYEQNEIKADTFWVQRKGYESDQIDQLYAGSANTDNHTNYGSAAESARQNYFGRVAYTLKDRYILQFHFRYDGSDRFPDGERFGFFPGVSAGWRVSEEPFFNVPVISNLKLRASWGKLGNDRVNRFQYLNLFSYAASNAGYVFDGSDVNVLVPGVAANPSITWETKETTNFGLDAGFFDNRLNFVLDVFFENRKDILAPRNVTVPNYTGLSLPDENIGEVENKGFDAQLNYQNSFGPVKFRVGSNITYARNKIIFMDEAGLYPEDYQSREGHAIGASLVYDYVGIYRTQEDLDTYPGFDGAVLGDPIFRDVNGDGILNTSDRIREDRTNIPQLQYGFNFGLEYHGFDFSALFQGQAKVSQYLRYTFNNGNNALAYFLENAWTEDNPDAALPAFNRGTASNQLNTLWLRDVSFLRLKNIELGYTLPTSVVSKVGFQNVRVYVNGYNLLTFDGLKKDGLTDPESVNIEGWQFPHTKSVNFGFNLTF